MNPEHLLKLTKFILALKAKVKCPICLDLAEITVELGCAHRFCNTCLQQLRLENLPVCPLCKLPISKRSPVYKDHFADDLSKFVDRSCQLIKETYAHEVDELNNSRDKLEEIIDRAPQDVRPFYAPDDISNLSQFKKPTEDVFDKLKSQPVKCYINKKKPPDKKEKPKVLDFIDGDTKTKIINWLNDNQQKLDTLTQSPSIFISDDEADFELPSISQVPFNRKQKQTNRVRSQSLLIPRNLDEPLLKRYHSLAQGLNEDDYAIEEVHSETLVKQVERKVLQNMLEDECLAKMEGFAKKSKGTPKKEKITPKKGRKVPNKKRNSHNPDSGSSGWDRIKDVNKTIKKARKEPKKLNISLQETATGNTKKSPKGNTKASPVEKAVAKTKISTKNSTKESPVEKSIKKLNKSPEASAGIENKENKNNKQKVSMEVDNSKEPANNTFNLSVIENYLEKNIDKVKVTPDRNSSLDMDIDVPSDSAKKLKEINIENKHSTNGKDKSFDEEVFLLPTQITPESANQNSAICFVAPVSENFNDIDNIAVRLSDNLQCCISSATNLSNDLANSLVECFTNVKTYIDKILLLRSDITEREIQTSQVRQAPKNDKATQIEAMKFSCKAAQTDMTPLKKLSVKHVQTSQKVFLDAEVQTDVAVCVDQEVQVSAGEKSVEQVMMQSGRCSLSLPDASDKNIKNKSAVTKISTQTKITEVSNVEKSEDEENILFFTKTSQSAGRDNQEKHASGESSKVSKTISRSGSRDSLLICTLDPTASNKSEKKINRKLAFGETQNRTFKRIRMPDSDSDSDEDGKPSKRKFIRDDLTVEFVDTERGGKDSSQTKDASSSESEKIDYDKYLIEVMARYGTPPQKKTSHNKSLQPESKVSSNLPPRNNRNSQEKSVSQKRKSQYLPIESQANESQKSNGDHIFTAHLTFQENLDKFENEIFQYEQNVKTHSTECDLVENTPMLSPKPKNPRLVSNKKKDTKKDAMKKPLQILSKGSALTAHTSKRNALLDEESLSNLTQKEPSTLNRNIDNLLSQTEKCTDDVAGILEDLRNDDDFFKTNMDCEEIVEEKIDLPKSQAKHSETPDDITMADLADNSKDIRAEKKKLNISREDIDKITTSLNGFEDDDIDAELEKISFTAEQRKLNENENNRIRIVQNIKLRSQDKRVIESALTDVIESSDVSDDDIVETTPQKKKNSFKHGALEELENNSMDNLDICLPPPPGFDDDIETSPARDNPRESPFNNEDGCQPLEGNKSSVTPDRLTDFIVTPETKACIETEASQRENSEHSLTFKPAFVTPNRPRKDNDVPIPSTLRVSQHLENEPGNNGFSPVTKSAVKLSQAKYSPLVLTSRLSIKKPNLMTSTPNQKSILNYVRPSQESPSQKPKPCIMWSRILNKDLNVFTQLEVKKLVTTAASFSPRVTHLVVLVDEKGRIVSHTAKILIAIAAGIWVVRYEWAQDCFKLNRIVTEEPYEALDTTGIPGPQISRLTRETKPLFKNFRFYCASPILTIPKSDLENMLQLSGGEIARDLSDLVRDGKVNIILTESSASEDTEQFENLLQTHKAVTVDVEWLTRCIGQYKLVSFRAFLVSGDDSNICDLGYPSTLVESVPITLTEAM